MRKTKPFSVCSGKGFGFLRAVAMGAGRNYDGGLATRAETAQMFKNILENG